MEDMGELEDSEEGIADMVADMGCMMGMDSIAALTRILTAINWEGTAATRVLLQGRIIDLAYSSHRVAARL